MKLRVPIDVVILRLLSDGEITNPVRTHWRINEEHGEDLRNGFDVDDWGIDYVQQRLGHLANIDLLEKVPPETSGLYRMSDLGWVALDQFLETEEPEFDYVEIAMKTDELERREVAREELPWIED